MLFMLIITIIYRLCFMRNIYLVNFEEIANILVNFEFGRTNGILSQRLLLLLTSLNDDLFYINDR